MAHPARASAPKILWPFAALWDLLAFILRATGRIVGVVLSLVLMVAGVALILSVLGVPVGVPLLVLGFLLLVRSMF
jgi:hypothetical protein